MKQLTSQQNEIHQQALSLVSDRASVDVKLIEILQQVERLKIYRAFEQNSVFSYAVEVLGLDKSVVYPLITIARKSIVIPELKAAIADRSLTVAKASRIVATLDGSNAVELIEFAKGHQRDEIDFEIAKRNPKAQSRDKMKHLSEDFVEVKLCMTKVTFDKLKRAESLEAQKGKPFKWGDVLESALEIYLDKNDPVRKAERSVKKKITINEKAKPKVTNSYRRSPLTAEQKHAVFLRDQGRCTHEGHSKKRCNSDKWTEIHHIISIAQGGTNDIDNLTALCSFHHDLVHQMSLPIEGQVTWLRSPSRPYRAW